MKQKTYKQKQSFEERAADTPYGEPIPAFREHEMDISSYKPGKHKLIQRGAMIECETPGHRHGFLAHGKVLTKEKNKYILKDIAVA